MGKKIKITTSKATIIVVNFPVQRGNAIAAAILCNPNFGEKDFRGSTPLGPVSKISEDVWKGIVEFQVEFDLNEPEPSTTSKQIEIHYFKDYLNDDFFGDCATATESGLSLLIANGVVLDNPEKPHFISKINSEDDRAKSQEQMESYFNELSKVWSNPHIFLTP